MDLILLPRRGAADDAADERSLYAAEGRARLAALLAWLVAADQEEEGVDLYAFLPTERGEGDRCLAFLAARAAVPSAVYLLLAPEQVTRELLARLEDDGPRRLLVQAAPGGHERTERALQALAEHLLATPSSALRFGFWQPAEPDGACFRRVRSFLDYGIPAELVDSPLFTLPEPAAPGAADLPPELAALPTGCQIYGNTVTLDAAGAVRFCPRDGGAEGIDLGNLFADTPERILLRKGQHARRAGALEVCRSCQLRGRFFWPRRTGAAVDELYRVGLNAQGPLPPFRVADLRHLDLSLLPPAEQEAEIEAFAERLLAWRARMEEIGTVEPGAVSVETPVFKGSFLIPCVESALHQTSTDWRLSLLWDGGDDLSRRILERLAALDHPRIAVHFEPNRGIARARRLLSERAGGEFILPLDDDDVLAAEAVERFLAGARSRPWCGIVRARREFIDESGAPVEMDPWFPFEPRHYQDGMVTDLYNHCQPYLIRRAAYARTAGWEGFADFKFAGEDCDIFTKVEEVASIELLDEVLYHYRLHGRRASLWLKPEGALEMWRRLADKTIARAGLPLARSNEVQPFRYRRLPQPRGRQEEIDFVIPFYEQDEAELPYPYSRPPSAFEPVLVKLDGRNRCALPLPPGCGRLSRIVVVASSEGSLHGALEARVVSRSTGEPVAAGVYALRGESLYFRDLSIPLAVCGAAPAAAELRLELAFRPDRRNYHDLLLLQLPPLPPDDRPHLMLQLFRQRPGHSRGQLERCLRSLARCGVADDAVHVIERQQSSAANRNEGSARGARPYVCYLDDDVEVVAPDTFDLLLAALHEREADLVAPKILNGQGTIFCADPYFNRRWRPAPRGLGAPDQGQYDYLAEVPWLPSTLLLVRRHVVRAVGGFDEVYVGSQMEDVDFCLKARRRGFRCLYAGQVAVVHHNRQRNHSFADNFDLFYRKWKHHPELFAAPAEEARPLAPGALRLAAAP